jgi:WhiB family redox-sensing transcriptional regulator
MDVDYRMKPPGVGDRAVFPELPRADWMQDAACREVDPDWFFSEDRSEQAKAVLTCEMCGVREECLEYGLQAGTYGIWAGFLPHELDRVRQRRRK